MCRERSAEAEALSRYWVLSRSAQSVSQHAPAKARAGSPISGRGITPYELGALAHDDDDDGEQGRGFVVWSDVGERVRRGGERRRGEQDDLLVGTSELRSRVQVLHPTCPSARPTW